MGGVGQGQEKITPAKFPSVPARTRRKGGVGEFRRVLAKNRGQSRHLAFQSKTPQKNTLSLGEKEIRRAPCLPAGRQNEKSKEYFSVIWRAERAVAGLASLVWFRSAVFDKIGSSQTVKAHHKTTLKGGFVVRLAGIEPAASPM